jgi:hypothetical protein
MREAKPSVQNSHLDMLSKATGQALSEEVDHLADLRAFRDTLTLATFAALHRRASPTAGALNPRGYHLASRPESKLDGGEAHCT